MQQRFKIFTLIFFMLCIIQNSFSQQNVNGWYWANSLPQSNDLSWVQIVDDTHFYASGANGTFMKSTDGGDSWIINTDAGVKDELFGVGSSKRINTCWFFNANTGIVAGLSNFDDGGIIKRTTDGGKTFNSISLGVSSGLPSISDIFFMNSSTGYLCGNNIVKALKTTNGGITWSALPNLQDYTYNYTEITATNANNIYLTCGEGNRILRTSNGGSSWTEDLIVHPNDLTFTDIQFKDSNTGFISGNPNYFAYTTNAGVSWMQTFFPDASNGIYDLKLVGSTVYALSSFDKYYYTSDLGQNWGTVVFDDPTNFNRPVPFFVYALDINQNNAIVVGANGKINISNDNGSTWRNKNYSVGNNEMTFPSVYALPGTDYVWAGGSNGAIIASDNRGANWYKYQTNALYSFNEIEMTNSSTGYAVGGSFFAGVGYCYKTTNSGGSWFALTIPNVNAPYNGITFVNQNTGWIFGGYSVSGTPALIYKTTNGGSSWILQAVTPADNSFVVDGDMADANTGYCLGGNKVWKTTNGGVNWNRLGNLPEDILWSCIKVFSGSTIYLGGNNSIYKSTDNGNTWQRKFIPITQEVIFDMDWSDPDNGTVAGASGYTAKTSDGGATWTERNTGSSTLTSVTMASPNLVYVSSDRNVYGAVLRLNDLNTSITLNLKIGIQGFWNGSVQVGDTVRCHLRNSSAPFNEVEVTKAVINNSGNGTFTFNSAPSGSYYIEITHRNSLETWNASPLVLMSGGSVNYDFTTSVSQAYGSNLILNNGRYCNYSGDVNQNGNIDLNDVVLVNNGASVFTSGYVTEDISGDNFVDLSDLIGTFNNAANFISKITP